jgi:hypothetical protein
MSDTFRAMPANEMPDVDAVIVRLLVYTKRRLGEALWSASHTPVAHTRRLPNGNVRVSRSV